MALKMMMMGDDRMIKNRMMILVKMDDRREGVGMVVLTCWRW